MNTSPTLTVLVSVLVVEYGYLDPQNSDILFPGLLKPGPYEFKYTSVPQTALNNRVCPSLSGAVVGGSSAVNGMVWQRASAADYDEWEDLGNSGWGWSDLYPYFKKVSKPTFASRDICQSRSERNIHSSEESLCGGVLYLLGRICPWQIRSYPSQLSCLSIPHH